MSCWHSHLLLSNPSDVILANGTTVNIEAMSQTSRGRDPWNDFVSYTAVDVPRVKLVQPVLQKKIEIHGGGAMPLVTTDDPAA